MPDISMCRNITCPFRSNCYRFLAKPSEFRQAYAFFKPYTNENEDLVCDYFWEIKPIHKLNNGRGATLCNQCSVIISEGRTSDLLCKNCGG